MATNCIKCNTFLRKTTGSKKVISSQAEADDATEKIGKLVNIDDVFCSNCRVAVSRPSKPQNVDQIVEDFNITSQPSCSQSSSTSSIQSTSEVPTTTTCSTSTELEYVEMIFARVVSTHKYCCVCGASTNLTVVPFEARKQVFIKRTLYMPLGNRCCKGHLIKKRFYDEEINTLRIYSNKSIFEVKDLQKLLGQLAVDSNSTIIAQIGDYSFLEERLIMFTGLSWQNVIKLRTMLTSMRKSGNRGVTQALAVFLFKLRSGNSNAIVSSIFGLEHAQQVSDYSKEVINSFEKDILSNQFGVNAISRDTIVANVSSTARKLFKLNEDQAMIICDGTYIRHQKSTNNEYQRKSYSGQKKVPLCKPFTICTTNGYVIDMLGPYTANINDAEIMKTVMDDANGLSSLLKKGDIIVVDRGFRDVVAPLEELGLTVLIPAHKGNRPQLTSRESNDSRFVTKVRWPVEAVHGDIKQKYRLLDHKLDNKLLPKVRSYCRIACFLHNEFGKRLDSDDGMSDQVIAMMNLQHAKENTLAIEVDNNRWARRKVPFSTITSNDLLDFPELSERDLKILFTGSYQLSQAVSYLAEMLIENDTITLQYVKATPNILKFQVRSRHINSKTYRCFIEYRSNINTISGIHRYSCDCANGRRTVGCCSHIAAIVYYLSHARYLTKIIRPSEILSRLFTVEGVDAVIEEDSDDD